MNAIWCYCNVLNGLMWAMPLSGMVEISSFWINTDLKCWLSMLALVRLSDLMNPSLS